MHFVRYLASEKVRNFLNNRTPRRVPLTRNSLSRISTSPRRRGEVKKSPSRLLPPCREIGQGLLVGCGIEPENRTAALHLFGDEILERGHLEGFVGDFIGEMGGDDDHAIAVAED